MTVDYYRRTLPIAKKVEALRFVTEVLLENQSVQAEIERRVEKLHVSYYMAWLHGLG